MNQQQWLFFDALSKDRAENAKMLEKPSMRGIKKSVVEKYSDQAHFIYELLQNADDVGATEVSFELFSDRLMFRHNGKRYFSVSNPEEEGKDSELGTLGDVNAITAIANSNKKSDSTIGKFGVGFKAVFQYTNTPHIYDPNLAFKIERFIVPVKLVEDLKARREHETVFVFPFDSDTISAEQACDDILIKMDSLVYPQLFLNSLEVIHFKHDTIHIRYEKQILKSMYSGTMLVEEIALEKKHNHKRSTEYLWLFSQNDAKGYQCCVGFFYDGKKHLKPANLPAFCFFPTKVNTGLGFVVHAPFLLTDSREGIQASSSHNRTMISEIADLSVQAMLFIRNISENNETQIEWDNLFDIIPYNRSAFPPADNRDIVSFVQVYERLTECLRNERILPGKNSYIYASEAIWANTTQTTELVDDAQLSDLQNTTRASWLNIGTGYESCRSANLILFNYLSQTLGIGLVSDISLIGKIDDSFISNQPHDWLLKLYSYIEKDKNRVRAATYKPIFIDRTGKPAAAYINDNGKRAVLFMPVDNIEGFSTIDDNLFSHEETKAIAKALEIKVPSLLDEAYNTVLPLCDKSTPSESDKLFKKLYVCFLQCSHIDRERLIESIKNHPVVIARRNEDEDYSVCKPDTVYYPVPELKQYFAHSTGVRFIDLKHYQDLNLPSEDKLGVFLKAIGISAVPRVYTLRLTDDLYSAREYVAPNVHLDYATREISIEIPYIDGINEVIQSISKGFSKEMSLCLWHTLIQICKSFGLDSEYSYGGLEERLQGIRRYFYRTEKSERFETLTVYQLRHLPWLLNNSGELVAPSEILLGEINKGYDLESQAGQKVIEFLQIRQEEDAAEELLSESQKSRLAIGELFADCSEEELRKLLAMKKEMRSGAKPSVDEQIHNATSSHTEVSDSHNDGSDVESSLVNDADDTTDSRSRVIRKLNRMKSTEMGHDARNIESTDSTLDTIDEDEYTKPTIDYQKLIEQRLKKSNAEIDAIALVQQYDDEANHYPKYTFGWFKALLNLEILASNQNTTAKKVFSISFGRVRREPDTERTLILEHPDRYIPQNMEDLADISLVLRGDGFERSVAIEVVNVHSYTLRAKLKNIDQISKIDLGEVKQATISVQNPVFLLDELMNALSALELDDYASMRDKLCANIRFIFGPPGTGKTTYLTSDVILPLMRRKENTRILVLTPTNKAADVLTTRIMGKASEKECDEWLIRFGATGDEIVEQSGVFRDKATDIQSFAKCVVITTIARFPYDFFMPGNKRIFLNAINWDYIVIDEASMIPLVSIIYPLFKKEPTEFVVAGDPFQIEPITNVDRWKDENIYTLVGLQSFRENPSTVPHQYPVKLLMTQYRSTPAVGNVFSKLTYNGSLSHFRSADSAKNLHLERYLGIKPLNLIKFPVSKYESIYRVKRLQGKTSYQVYSALFTFEFTRYMADKLAHSNPGKPFSIGIIAPYRGEADLIEKMVATIKHPREITIQVGTIHGFQGDECDIILTVFNPPPKITDSPNMFLNKRNIINVAISRARDYLVVIMPDDQTENIHNLKLIKQVETLCKENPGECREYTTPELEQIMFGRTDYLELNSFSTGHQSVNVYDLPERQYEIRSEDSAVDIQIHKNAISCTPHASIDSANMEDNMSTSTIDAQTQHSRHTVNGPEIFVVPNKALCCPVDKERLASVYIDVSRQDGKMRKLGVNRCPICKRYYLFKPEITASVNRLQITIRPIDELFTTVERVFSKSDGDGIVVERFIRNGTRYIRARFDNGIQEYNEDQVFSNGMVRRLK